MTKQLILGIVGEGTTDYRFLSSIIRRTFEDLAFQCSGNVEILDIQEIYIQNKRFKDFLYSAAKKGHNEFGIMILCVHKDADAKNDVNVFRNSMDPGIELITKSDEKICKNIVPVVPIVETEAWMLADKILLKEEIGTDKTDVQLNISENPELISDPKQRITEAIRIAYKDFPRRRRKPEISELYKPIGQKISIVNLRKLDSFRKFEMAAKNSLIKMNFIIE